MTVKPKGFGIKTVLDAMLQMLNPVQALLVRARRAVASKRRPLAFPLRLEQLEDRVTPTGPISTLATFNVSNGAGPNALIMDSSGNLYGTTQLGGTEPGDGTVFELAKGSGTINTLASFNYSQSNTAALAGLIMDSSGNLYGTTAKGGTDNEGTIYELAKGSGTINTLASFNVSNGGAPSGGLVMDSSDNLYGTTEGGGADELGTVFELAKGSGTITTLASFNKSNGANPTAVLIMDSSGNLYSTTQEGGANNDGTVFELAKGSGTINTLASFNGSNGQFPVGDVIMDSSGNLYSTTQIGGPTAGDYGSVFELAKGSGTINTLASFNGSNGGAPSTLIMDSSGNLYGTTENGGGADNAGTIFEIQAEPTTTSISAPTVTYGSNSVVTVRVTSSGGTPTGNVSLTVNNGTPITQALVNGSSTFTLTGLNAGSYNLSASYAAQGGFGASSNTGSLTVNQVAPTVTSTADDGSMGTLRWVITQLDANSANFTSNQIDFNIGAAGSAQTIDLTSALPSLTIVGVFIDGLSQGGSGNTTRLITLNGTGAGSSSDGLLVQGSGDIVSGLIIENFSKNGIEVAGSNNTIGGTTTGAGNVVSGNKGDGILIDSGGSGILVDGNILGLDATGTTALANSGNGLEIQGTNNTIGGPFLAARNYISGNSKVGVLLGSSASGNQVLDGFIGLNTTGTVGVGNLNGVEIAGSSNTLGSTAGGGFNYISGNSGDGVLIDSTAKNTLVQNNFIGTDTSNQKGIANSIGIEVAGVGTTIGGTVSGARNFVSDSKSDGVKIDSTGSGTVLLGNSIGINAANAALGNGGNGLNILSSSNTIGGTASGSRNIISANAKDGVLIASGAGGNLALNNFIGVDLTGSKALANSANGIEIASTGNTIGGTASAAQNQISGNTNDGVLLDSTASGNQVLGNYIGVNHTGSAAVANKVGIEDAGSSNTIGGSVSGARNYISGNTGDGVLIDTGASSDQIQGNFLGLNPSGNAALANGGNGIEIQGTKNTLGGTVLAARNYISGNSNDGVLFGSSASGNQVMGNFIGLDISGTHGVGNVNYGISLAGSNNTLGGTSSAYTNVISGSTKDGILLAATASGNVIQGNNVGTVYNGQTSLANGIGIEVMGTNNTIGGTAAGARNIVSGNSGDGVLLDSGASGTVLLGNLIGVSAINKALANSGNGLDVVSNNNTIGGTASGARNVLSGNSKDGMLIASGASGNQALGNYIGTDIYTLGALANGSNGVEIGGSGNAIGGTASAAKNIISGNVGDGVKIDSGASGNQVLGNYIGTNLNGLSALGNGTGIEDGGSSNTLGGSVSGSRNVISGNTGDAILLDSSASGDAVWQNYIGIIASTGNAGLANGKNGVEVQGDNNTIGGTVFLQRNYISGSGNDGVLLGSSASGNLLLNNFIGIAVNGTTGVSNITGIEIAGTGNTIGGTVAGSTNVISANKNDGILIDSTGSGNLVLGNNVGPDYTGNGAGVANSGNGIEIAGTGNTLGGTTSAAKNIISGNVGDGVKIDSTGSGNVVMGNNIGVNRSGATLHNSGNGVEIAGNNNTVGGTVSGADNVISGNSTNGVLVSAGSGDTISRNSIFANGALGISLASGANNNIVAPTITFATISGRTLTVQGSFTAATANVSYVLEFFANPTGDGEGKIYLGSLTVTPTTTGSQSFTFTTTTTVTGANPLITATLTDAADGASTFSNGVVS